MRILCLLKSVGELDEPLAAPSANRFGRVSPTTAQHVLDELGGRIPLIVDAGPTEHGIESTIVAVRGGRIAVLRRGPITHEQLSEFADIVSRYRDTKNFRSRAIAVALYADNPIAFD